LLFLGGSSVIAVADPPAIRDVLAEVGPRLRRLRVRRGVTLTALAAETGISKSTLSRLETGQRKPSLELLLLLAERIRSRSTSSSAGPRSATRASASSRSAATDVSCSR
jgi:transcriptional regulator with XRE-family HTH domain